MDKFHWHLFSFVYEDVKKRRTASTYVGYETQAVNKSAIERAKERAGMPEGSVCIAVSYLGHMTNEEFDA